MNACPACNVTAPTFNFLPPYNACLDFSNYRIILISSQSPGSPSHRNQALEWWRFTNLLKQSTFLERETGLVHSA